MKHTFVKIFVFMIVVIGIYAYVGQLLPQFEEYPPAKKVITPKTSTEDLISFGREILRNKGGCLICHKDSETGNERGPDLRLAAAVATTRKSGMSAEAYLIDSLVSPDNSLAPGYPNIMPSAIKPPANLSMAEVKAVVAYLQSLGGMESTVKVQAEDVAMQTSKDPVHPGRVLMNQHGCIACHKVEGEGGAIGPDLTKAALNREPTELMQKVIDPRIWTTPGYPAGVMPVGKTIPENDRYEIVAYLASVVGKSYSPSTTSLWSHEGVRLGLVILIFNIGLLTALGLVRRRGKKGGQS